jgi:hypothetical protein
MNEPMYNAANNTFTSDPKKIQWYCDTPIEMRKFMDRRNFTPVNYEFNSIITPNEIGILTETIKNCKNPKSNKYTPRNFSQEEKEKEKEKKNNENNDEKNDIQINWLIVAIIIIVVIVLIIIGFFIKGSSTISQVGGALQLLAKFINI